MTEEAGLRQTDAGLVPQGGGWFVVNPKESRWDASGHAGRYCRFEGEVEFEQYGVNIHVLEPGQANALYHGEEGQEDFLVLAGECVVVIEEQERHLRAWDFVHCPAWTRHVFVGAGTGPCAILMIGARGSEGLVYPVSEVARRYGASVDVETTSPREAYAGFPSFEAAPYREGDLP